MWEVEKVRVELLLQHRQLKRDKKMLPKCLKVVKRERGGHCDSWQALVTFGKQEMFYSTHDKLKYMYGANFLLKSGSLDDCIRCKMRVLQSRYRKYKRH